MEIGKALDLAQSMLWAHGLSSWTVSINNSNTYLGYCWFAPRRRIELSRNHILVDNDNVIMNTILHEVAHGLLGKPGHGSDWKQIAMAIGAKPTRCNLDSVVSMQGKYKIACQCGYSYQQRKQPKALFTYARCPKCGEKIFWEIM